MKQLNTIPEYLRVISDLSVQNFEMLNGLYRSLTSTKDFIEVNYNHELYKLPSFINLFAKVSALENNFQSLVEVDGIGGAGIYVNGNNRKLKLCPFECKPVSIVFDKKDKIYSIIYNKEKDITNLSENLQYSLQIALENVNVKAHKYRVELYDFESPSPVATYDAVRKYNTNAISFEGTPEEIEEGLNQYISIKDIKYTVSLTNDLVEQYEFSWSNRKKRPDGTLPPNIFSIKYNSTSKYAATLSSGMILTTADRMCSFVITSVSADTMQIASINGAYALNESDKLYIKNDITEPHISIVLPNLKIKSMKIAAYADESNAIGEFSDPIDIFALGNDNRIVPVDSNEWVGDTTIFNEYVESLEGIKSTKMNDYINQIYDMYKKNKINMSSDAISDMLITLTSQDSVTASFYNFDFSSNSEIDNIKNNLTSISNKIFVLEQTPTPTLLEAEELKNLKEQRVNLTEKLSEASINSNIYSTNYKDGILKLTFDALQNQNGKDAFCCYEVRYKIRNYNNSTSDFFYASTMTRDIIKKDGVYEYADTHIPYILDIIVPKNAYIDYQFRVKYWEEFPNTYAWTEWSQMQSVINQVSTNIDVSAITANIINTLRATGVFSHIDGESMNTHSAEQISTQFLSVGGQTKPLDKVLNEVMKTFASLQQSIFLRTLDDKPDSYGACILYYDEIKNRGYCYELKNDVIPTVDGTTEYAVFVYNPSERAVEVSAKVQDPNASDDKKIVIQPNERIPAQVTKEAKILEKEIMKYPLLLPLDTILLKSI